MSKLDDILKAYGESLTGNELTDFWSAEKEQVKALMLEIARNATATRVSKDKFRYIDIEVFEKMVNDL